MRGVYTFLRVFTARRVFFGVFMPWVRYNISKPVWWMVFVLCLSHGYTSEAAAGKIICTVCQKPITGRYHMVDGRPYCPRPGCYSSIFPECAECGRRVGANYIRMGDKAFCGEACLIRSLPVCSVCHKRIRGAYKVLNGKPYCGPACMDKAVGKCERCGVPLYQSVVINGHKFCLKCAEKPVCWGCRLPKPLVKKLGDGRSLCADCDRGAVLSPAKAEELYRTARYEQKRITGVVSPTTPPLRLVDQDVLKASAPETADTDAAQWGVYRREVTIRSQRKMMSKRTVTQTVGVNEQVLILRGLSRKNFIATAAHELTHDLLAENFPDIPGKAPNWVQEGMCQYVAAGVCLMNGWFKELKAIETAPDNDYGEGYRFFKRKFGDTDWDEVIAWMRTVDVTQLPAVPPQE